MDLSSGSPKTRQGLPGGTAETCRELVGVAHGFLLATTRHWVAISLLTAVPRKRVKLRSEAQPLLPQQ